MTMEWSHKHLKAITFILQHFLNYQDLKRCRNTSRKYHIGRSLNRQFVLLLIVPLSKQCKTVAQPNSITAKAIMVIPVWGSYFVSWLVQTTQNIKTYKTLIVLLRKEIEHKCGLNQTRPGSWGGNEDWTEPFQERYISKPSPKSTKTSIETI